MTSEREVVPMEQEDEESSDSNSPHAKFQKVSRKGPLITWTIEHFSYWYAAQSGDLSSCLFSTLYGTQWRMVLRERTLEPVLARDCPKGPVTVTVGFQFSVLGESGSTVPVSAPLTRTFGRTDEFGCGSSFCPDTFSSSDRVTLQCHLWRERSERPLVKSCEGTTHVTKLKSSVEKSIKVFQKSSSSTDSRLPRESQPTLKVPRESQPTLKVPIHKTFKLRYNLFRDGDHRDDMLRMNLLFMDPSPTAANNRISLLDASGLVISSSPICHHFFQSERESWTIPWHVRRSQVPKHVSKGSFRIRHELDTGCDDTVLGPAKRTYYCHPPLKKVGYSLSDDMSRLLLSPAGCQGDVTLVSGDGVSLSAHRTILCARSAVFTAMMERDMAERQSGTINIADMGGKTLGQLLSFLYTGRLDKEEELDCDTLAQLYTAGDKYGLLALKKRCGVLLGDRVTVDNACDVLEFSDLHCDGGMRGPALSVLCSRTADILISEEWRSLEDKKRKLAEEVVAEIRLKRMKNS